MSATHQKYRVVCRTSAITPNVMYANGVNRLSPWIRQGLGNLVICTNNSGVNTKGFDVQTGETNKRTKKRVATIETF